MLAYPYIQANASVNNLSLAYELASRLPHVICASVLLKGF